MDGIIVTAVNPHPYVATPDHIARCDALIEDHVDRHGTDDIIGCLATNYHIREQFNAEAVHAVRTDAASDAARRLGVPCETATDWASDRDITRAILRHFRDSPRYDFANAVRAMSRLLLADSVVDALRLADEAETIDA